MRFGRVLQVVVACFLVSGFVSEPAWAWGAVGHRMINRLAVQYLPADAPAFLRNGTAMDTVEYLAPEPDRWRSKGEPELGAATEGDHFLDYEWAVYGGKPCSEADATAQSSSVKPGAPHLPCVGGLAFPKRRYDFLRALAAAQPAHPDLKLDERVGFQPWAVEEVWQRLKNDLREYRKLVAANQDTRPDELAILYDCGWLGHYVGDGSQPLHVTVQYNGWTGPNPNGYSTSNKIHSKFETVYVNGNVKRDADILPLVAASKVTPIDDEWTQYWQYLQHTNSLVERVYQLDKTGAFDGAGTPEGKAFVNERIAAGAIELRDLIEAAWVHSADPVEEYKGPQ